MEAATSKLEGHLREYFALIVDVMLPRTDADMKAAERLEKERAQLLDVFDQASSLGSAGDLENQKRTKFLIDAKDQELDKLTDLEGGVRLLEQLSKVLQELKLLIDAKDQDLDKLTDFDGGIHLLEQLSKGGRLKLLTIILTARTLQGLRERAERLVETGKFYWMPKPATAESVISIIEKHCG
jgi:hypothetical protein